MSSSQQSWLSPDVEAQKEQADNNDWHKTPAENEVGGGTTSTKSTAPASSSTSAEKTSSEQQGRRRGWIFWFHLCVGIVLSILFIIAAVVEWNNANREMYVNYIDDDYTLNIVLGGNNNPSNTKNQSSMWGIFYIIHAVLAICGTVRLLACKTFWTKPLLVGGLCILIWSIVLLSLASVNLAQSSKPNGNYNNKQRTYRQDVGYELGGSILGCLSCMYFMSMCLCCDRAPTTTSSAE